MKKRPNLFKNVSGFSLVEVMVAAGMLGVVSLGVMQVTQNANKTSKAVGQQVELLDLQSRVKRALTNQAGCTQSLSGVLVTGMGATFGTGRDVNDIFNSGGASSAVTRGNQYGQGAGSLIVDDIEAFNFVNSGQPVINNRYFGTVTVGFQAVKGSASATDTTHRNSSYGTRTVVKTSDPISVSVDATTNAIVSCYQDQNQFVTAACNAMGGQFNAGLGLCENIQIQNSTTNGTGNLDQNGPRQFAVIARGPVVNAAGTGEGSIKADGGLVIGDPFSDKPGTFPLQGATGDTNGPGIGNAIIGNSATVIDDGLALAARTADLAADGNSGLGSGSLLLQRSLRVGSVGAAAGPGQSGGATQLNAGEGYFLDRLTALGGLNVGIGRLDTPAGDAVITSQLTVGNSLNPAAGESIRVEGGTGFIVNGTSEVQLGVANAADSQVQFHRANTIPFTIREATLRKFEVSETGQVTVFRDQTSPGTSEDVSWRITDLGRIDIRDTTNNQLRLRLAAGNFNDSYRPSYIYNMPQYTAGSLNATTEREIPTKKWVTEAIYHALSDTADFSSLLNGITTFLADNPFDAVAGYVCDNMRVRDANTGAFTSGSWNSGTRQCNIENNACGGTAAAECANHYAGNYWASGNLRADGTLYVEGGSTLRGVTYIGANVTGSLALRVYGQTRFDNFVNIYGASSYLYNRNSWIRSGTYLYANTYVYGTTYVRGRGTAKTGLSGICGETGCATRFGRYKCNNGGVVIGVANGRLVCAQSGGGGSNPVAF